MTKAVVLFAVIALGACGAEAKNEAPAAAPSAEASAAPSAEPSAPPPPAPKSLYDRLNGNTGITKLVDDAIAGIKADKRVAKYLPKDPKKLAALHDDLVSQIAAGAGGPASTRTDPRAAVTAMKIKAKDFDFIIEDITKAAASLSDAEAKEILEALSSMKDSLAVGAKK
jgi:truncated hemoglobin YjbI